MLCRLAWGSVARARRDYLIYLLTLTLGVTVFYAFNTISLQVDLANVSIEGLDEVLGELLGNLTVFLGAVMGFLMVYANNFIMKRRNKEFGLYQVLGHDARPGRPHHGARDGHRVSRGARPRASSWALASPS